MSCVDVKIKNKKGGKEGRKGGKEGEKKEGRMERKNIGLKPDSHN